MWQRTYDRLLQQTIAAEMRADDAFILSSERLLARIDSRSRARTSRRSFWQ